MHAVATPERAGQVRCSRTRAAALSVSSCTKKWVPSTVMRSTPARVGLGREHAFGQVGAVGADDASRRRAATRGGRTTPARRRDGCRTRRTTPRPRAGTRAPPDRRDGRGTPTARTRPAPRVPSRSSAAGSRTTRAPCPGRPTPRAASGPSPTCGSRCPDPAGRRSRAWRSARRAGACARGPVAAGRPGSRCRRRAIRPRIATSSRPRWSSIATTSPAAATNPQSSNRSRRVAGAVAPEVDAHHPVVGGQRPGQRVEHPGAEAVGVEQDQRRAVATPVERPDGEAVVLDRPPLRCLWGGRHPAHATATSSGPITRVGYPAGHADRSRKPLAL